MTARRPDYSAPDWGSVVDPVSRDLFALEVLQSRFRIAPRPTLEEPLQFEPAEPTAFAEAVVIMRAIVAFEDPAGERDAAYPIDQMVAGRTIVTAWERRPRPRPVITGQAGPRWDNDRLLLALGLAPGRTSGIVHCPAHSPDRHPSLSVRRTPDDRVLVHCFGAACTFDDIITAVMP